MNKRPFSTDEETAIALCRTTYSGDCRCERNGTVICESMLREVEVLQPALSQLREAIALPTPLRDPDEMTCADGMQAADRIEALTEQLEAARADAKEAEAYAEELAGDQVDLCRQLIAAEDKLAKAVEALRKLHHAVCGETGFAACVRLDSGLAYPWPALDEADEMTRAIIAEIEGEKT